MISESEEQLFESRSSNESDQYKSAKSTPSSKRRKTSTSSKDSSMIIGTVSQVMPIRKPRSISRTSSRISVIQEQQHSLEAMIAELKTLNEIRDKEIQSIKKRIQACKNQVGSFDSSGESFTSFSDYVSEFSTEHSSGNKWKIGFTFLVIHFCLNNVCHMMVPKTPWIHNLLYTLMIAGHFFVSSGLLYLKINYWYITPPNVAQNFEEFTHMIGTILSGAAIFFLKFLQCSRERILFKSFQMSLTLLSFLTELWTTYLGEKFVFEDDPDFGDKILLVLQFINICLSIF